MTVVLQERSDVAISGRIHGTWSALAYVKEYVMKRQPAVYLLTNKPDGTLYTGLTSDLPKRIWQHRDKTTKGFTARYNLTRLVYFELSEDMYQAITREKQIKAGSREAKIKLLEKANPDWRDLYPEIAN
jgi:putative endonuclease